MSTIDALAGAGTIQPAGNRFNDLSSEEFIKIIFTELSNQDPFKPNDSSALLEQLNSIRSIESDMQLSKDLQGIVFQNQLATAGNLIGKRVAGMTADNDRVGGVVKSVARSGDEIALILDNGWILPIDNVEFIDQNPTPTPPVTPSPGAGAGAGTPTPPPTQSSVVANWGQGGPSDLNGDGAVDAQDLAKLLSGG
jgi:flagellar basal-body rod modification protein FlgD